MRLCALIVLCWNVVWMQTSVWAASLDRPVIMDSQMGELQIWLQQDTFNDSVDILNYSQRFPATAAKLDYYTAQKIGVAYAVSERFHLFYTLQQSNSHVTRFTEPKSIQTTILAQQLRAQYHLLKGEQWLISLEVGGRKHDSPKVDFYKYSFQSIQVSWPGHALVTLKSKDAAWLTALRAQWHTQKWTIHYGVEYRSVDVSASMTSQSSTVTSLLAAQAPQSQPWQESHVIYDLSLDYAITPTWKITADFQHYNISRHNYIPRKNKIDYNTNETLDLYLFWQMNKGFQLYAQAHLSQRSSLGMVPLSYNQRTNHKFKYPFGYLSSGVELAF